VLADGRDSVTITVTVVDSEGTAMAGRTVNLTVTGEGNTLTPASGQTNPNGVMAATLVSTSAGSKQVTASVDAEGGPVVLASRPTVEFVAVQPPQLVLKLTGLPASMTAGDTASVQVSIEDASSTVATSYRGTVRFSSSDPSAVLPADYTFTAADAGRKSFTGLSLRTAGSQTVTVVDTATASLTASGTVQVNPGNAARLVFRQQSGNHSVRASLGPVQVGLTDAFDNVTAVTAPAVTVALDPASGGLSGTETVAPVDGVATFTGLSVANEGNGYTLTASAPGLTSATSAAFNIVDDVAPARPELSQGATTTRSIVVQWTSVGDDGLLGTAASQELRYSTSDIVSDLDFAAATLVTTGAPQAAGMAESATLTGLTPSTNYYVALKVTDNAGNSVRSATLPVSTTNPVVTQLAFITQPMDGTAGTPLADVRVALQDEEGNTVTTATSAVALRLSNGQSFTPVNAVNGVATFSGLRIDTAGTGYRLEATSGALTAVQSNPFTIRPAAAASLELGGLAATVTAGAASSVVVTARDAYGNVAAGYTGTVHFTSTDAQAVLPPDTAFTEGDAGQKTFTGVELRTVGTRSITVTDTSTATLMATASTTVIAGSPSQLVFTTQPANGNVRATLAEVSVELRDAYGNTNTSSSLTVTVGLTGGNAAATLSGMLSTDAGSGVATFSDLSIDQEGTGFRLVANATGLTAATSNPFTITDNIAPAAAVISAAQVSSSSVRVSWMAVGDDGNLGTATSYDLRYASTAITNEAQFAAATQFATPPPRAPGTAESVVVTGLNLATDHYFALKVLDGAGNSSLSNSPRVAADPCAGVTCTPPAATCSANGRGIVTYTSACVPSGGVGVCQDTPTTSFCQSYETCSSAACVPVTAGSQAGGVIISEISSLGAEFIELRNTTGANIDVRGYTLRNAAGQEVDIRAPNDPNGTGSTPVTVPANGVLYGIANPSGSVPAGVGFIYGAPGTDFTLADTGDALAVYAAPPAGNLQDLVDFRSFVSNPNTPLTASHFVGFPGNSTQLDASVLTAAGNDTATNWCGSFYPSGARGSRVANTAGAANGNCGVAVINEVLIDGPGGDDGDGFIEIAGPGGAVIGGARITDVEGKGTAAGSLNAFGTYTIPAGTRIPADGILLIVDLNPDGRTTNVPNYVPGVDIGAASVDFENDGGDAYQLINAAGTALLDAVGHDVNGVNLDINTASNGLGMYETATALSSPAPSATWAASMARSPASTDTDNNRNDFHADPSPTPGLPNDVVNFTVTSITPDDTPAAATQATSITVIGTDLSPGMRLRVGAAATGALCTTVTNSTQAVCNVLPGTGAVTQVSLTFVNPASVGAANVTLPNIFTYTGTENGAGPGTLEADFCNLQFPADFTVARNALSPNLFGRIYEAGVTEAGGAPPGILAEVGYGSYTGTPAGPSDPRTSHTWRFFPATYNVQVGNDDEFMGSFLAPSTAATYAYTFRFSQDNGMRWTYCDLDGAGSNEGLIFDSTRLGVMTVQ
jgi:hypothetical protein